MAESPTERTLRLVREEWTAEANAERDRYKLQRDELLEAVRTFVQDTGKYDGALAEAAKRIEAENA